MQVSGLELPAVRHRELQTSQGVIHYVEAGEGDPLLLIHGGHGSWAHWIANIGPLAQHRRVLALDMPGFGQSYTPDRRLELSEYAEVIGSFIHTAGLRNVALAGFSFGTLVAATVAVNEPDTVNALTLINPPGIGERSPEALALPQRLSALAKEKGLRAGVTGTLNEVMLYNAHLIDEALVDLLTECVKRTRYETRTLSRGSQMIPILEQVSQKTMVLIGGADPYHRHELDGRRERINRTLGKDSVMIVNNAAHWLQYDQHEFFNKILLEFIAA
jgi:2-hydroxy-6-oxonona-2,4-dienedioate hydrolase